MPTYEYRCVSCEHQFERFQKMSDPPVEECERCGCPVNRVLFPVAVHFKGSGFYTTDYGRKKTLQCGSGNGSEGEKSSDGEKSSESKGGSTAGGSASGSAASSSSSGSNGSGGKNRVSSGA